MKSILSIIAIALAISLAIWMYTSSKREQIDTINSSAQVEQIESIKTDSIPKNNSSKTLDLSSQNLNKVPSYVFEIKELEELNLSDNNLEGALPAEIKHNENLKKINVSNNNMTGIPAEIGQLFKLETLDYSNNEITGLPLEIANLKNLQELDLSGNNYSETDLNQIKEALPNLKIISEEVIKNDIPEESASTETNDPQGVPSTEPKTQLNRACPTANFNEEFLCLLNNYRLQNSKDELNLNPALTNVAQEHSDWMNKAGTFSHTGENNSNFTSRCIDAGLVCDAENLAAGASSAKGLLGMWQDSPIHNANMLGSHNSIGLASSGKYFTLIFN